MLEALASSLVSGMKKRWPTEGSSTNHGNLTNEGLSLLLKIRLFARLHVEVVEVWLAGVDGPATRNAAEVGDWSRQALSRL